jgi:predicted nuclease of restriction endonuclease-like (RecB) superfamily
MKYDTLNGQYSELLEQLKNNVTSSQQQAILSVNKELILLYHTIGTKVIAQQKQQNWDSRAIERLSRDLSLAFPDIKGFSARNLVYMKLFAQTYPDREFVQRVAAKLPWFHLVTLLTQIKDDFKSLLPSPHSDLSHQTFKDPYIFDFLYLGAEIRERELENALLRHIEKFLLELGEGFSFLGRQYHIVIGEKDFYLDMLFYHVKLGCFIVVELKIDEFKPEYAGKMNVYLEAVDEQLRRPADNPSIGLILCKTKDKVIAEYALRTSTKPIGLAEYRLAESLPEHLQAELPTVEELEEELSKDFPEQNESVEK